MTHATDLAESKHAQMQQDIWSVGRCNTSLPDVRHLYDLEDGPSLASYTWPLSPRRYPTWFAPVFQCSIRLLRTHTPVTSLQTARHRHTVHRIYSEKTGFDTYAQNRDGEKYSSRPVRVGHDARMPLLEKVKEQLSQSSAGPSPDGRGFIQSIDQRWNPTLHLLLRGGHRTQESCRTIASAAINRYPPAHIIPLDGRNGLWNPIDKKVRASAVTGINNLLNRGFADDRSILKDDDVMLIIDADDTWFQLPAQLTLHRFLEALYEDNKRLLSMYGRIDSKDAEQRAYGRRNENGGGQLTGHKAKRASLPTNTVQKYSQRIIFAASKECHVPGKKLRSPACVAVPFSPLRPDTYDKLTDKSRTPDTYRPRWLTGGMVMGLVADLRLLYNHAADIAQFNPWLDEESILSKIFGEQEFMREYDRRRSSIGFFSMLGEKLGFIPLVKLNNLDMQIIPGARYEYSIGLDYNAKLFLPFLHSERDLTWLRYDDHKSLVKVQRERKIPFSTQLALPHDIATLQSPFYSPDDKTVAWHIAAYDDRVIPALPHPKLRSWSSLPLLTNIPTFTITPVFHLDIQVPETERMKNWKKMWFSQWIRPLMSETVRRLKKDVAGDDLDKENGKGGVWDFKEDWVSWKNFCKPWEEKVFGDRHGQWGVEVEDPRR
ncbi:hypothetical protein KEM54_003319 [Ascosphaera aggregata]|nr:hypothetical protein KEM54_003319 [Ascosphaera aggregata]